MDYNFISCTGVYDKDAPEKLLLSRPHLYKSGRLSLAYKAHLFWITIADAIYQSLVIFFVCIAVRILYF